jgi:CubicO group peptidase (beta-lactamase class C family)
MLSIHEIPKDMAMSATIENTGSGRWMIHPVLFLLVLLLSSCAELSVMEVSDPAAAISRLKSGGTLKNEVDTLVNPLIDSGENVSVVVGIVMPDAQTYVYGYGRTELDSGSIPDGKSIYSIGSVSKGFVSLLLFRMIEEGVVGRNETIGDILGSDFKPEDENVAKITLLQLATHSSGLPRHPQTIKLLYTFSCFLFTGNNFYEYIDSTEGIRYLNSISLDREQVGKYVYSNIGVGLLGYLLAKKTDKPLTELLQEKIFRPLGMDDTAIILNDEQKTRLAVAYSGDQPLFRFRNTPLEPWKFTYFMEGTGAVYSTADDLLLFIKAQLGFRPVPVLDAVIPKTQKIQVRADKISVASGWQVEKPFRNANEIYYQYGLTSGFNCYLGFDLQHKIGVVVLRNNFNWRDKIGHNLILRIAGSIQK